MKFQGKVLYYGSTATFDITSVTQARVVDDILFIRSDLGETPVIISTIKPVSHPLSRLEAAIRRGVQCVNQMNTQRGQLNYMERVEIKAEMDEAWAEINLILEELDEAAAQPEQKGQ